jgi:DNA-binding PadR family transcriptional regulator
MSKENKTAYAILGLLNHEPLTGYDIKKKIELIRYFWDAGFGQIYPTLKELEAGGLIIQHGDIPAGGALASNVRRKRKFYAITESGRQKLAGWLAIPAAQENVRYEILLKLFFGAMNPPEVNIHNIYEFRSRNQSHLNTLEQFDQELKNIVTTSPDHLYYWLTVLFGKYVYEAYLKWADEVIPYIKNIEKAGGKP